MDAYPSADKVRKYRTPAAIITNNVVLGKDLAGRNPGDTSYCSCGNCQPMIQPVEAFCCKEISGARTAWSNGFEKYMGSRCICDDEEIKEAVDNEKALKFFIKTVKTFSNATENDDVELMGRNYRFALYKKLIIMIHEFVGPKQRLPLPSCLVARVRDKYPEDDDEDYCGFLEAS